MASARVLICCSPNMSFRRSAFPGNFRKFLEISGGRRSAVGGRLRSAVGLPPPEVRFPWKFPESWFLSRGQISKRMSRKMRQGQSARHTLPARRLSHACVCARHTGACNMPWVQQRRCWRRTLRESSREVCRRRRGQLIDGGARCTARVRDAGGFDTTLRGVNLVPECARAC